MGEKTSIEWTEATWNPWHGCRKVSAGCANCYMYRDKRRFGQDPSVVVRSSSQTFNAPLRWREPEFVFTCSWSDFFIEEADTWRHEAWEIIRRTPHLTYQILTKRPERIREHLPWRRTPWQNVWLIVSAEDQESFDLRWPILETIPAAIRGISAEPLLGPIDMRGAMASGRLDWLIVGGESGPRARQMEKDWAQDLLAQSRGESIPFFFKQWGGMFRKRAGRKLLETHWSEFPRALCAELV